MESYSSNIIPIKKSSITRNGKTTEVFIIPALAMRQPDGTTRKIPHPQGYDSLTYKTMEEATKAIDLAGFGHSVDNKEVPAKEVHKQVAPSLSMTLIPLLTALKDSNNNVIASAAYALGELRSVEAINPLIELLGKDDNEVRTASAEALGKIGYPALRAVIELMEDSNWVSRNSAAIAIREMLKYNKINIMTALPSLTSLLSDENWIVRSSAATTIGKIAQYLRSEEADKTNPRN